MIIKKGKSDWAYVIFTALFVCAVGGGLMAYINDTVWQESFLFQEAGFGKAENKLAQTKTSAPEGSIAAEVKQERSNATDFKFAQAQDNPTEVVAAASLEQKFFTSFSAGPERSDARVKEAALKIYGGQDECLKVNFSTFDMNQCLIAAGKEYDSLLEDTYAKRLASLDKNAKEDPETASYYASEKDNLKKAMEAWKKYREAMCAAEYDSSLGGSIRVLEYSSCYISITLKQIFSL